MYVMDSGREDTRIGISASKKVGNSVVRHRFARLVRESFRLNKDILEEGKDIIVVARAAAKDKNFDKIESAFLHLCGLHNILKAVSYTHLRAHETDSYLVCRLLLEKKKKK